MRVQEQGASFREPIDVWRTCIWMSSETSDPVVQVINRNEKHVWLLHRTHGRSGDRDQRQQNQEPRPHHFPEAGPIRCVNQGVSVLQNSVLS